MNTIELIFKACLVLATFYIVHLYVRRFAKLQFKLYDPLYVMLHAAFAIGSLLVVADVLSDNVGFSTVAIQVAAYFYHRISRHSWKDGEPPTYMLSGPAPFDSLSAHPK